MTVYIPKETLDPLLETCFRSTITQTGLILCQSATFDQESTFTQLLSHPSWALMWNKLIPQFSDEDMTLLSEMVLPVSNKLQQSIAKLDLKAIFYPSIQVALFLADYQAIASMPTVWFGDFSKMNGKQLQNNTLLGSLLHFSALLEESVTFFTNVKTHFFIELYSRHSLSFTHQTTLFTKRSQSHHSCPFSTDFYLRTCFSCFFLNFCRMFHTKY